MAKETLAELHSQGLAQDTVQDMPLLQLMFTQGHTDSYRHSQQPYVFQKLIDKSALKKNRKGSANKKI